VRERGRHGRVPDRVRGRREFAVALVAGVVAAAIGYAASSAVVAYASA